MTITFVPGEPNKANHAIAQVLWKNHHIVTYGSGNNLIIYITTSGKQNLQTIYLENDPTAIAINSTNAFIAISFKSKIIILKPLNEYMVKPQWIQVLELNHDQQQQQLLLQSINCLSWACNENELIVGCDQYLTLYYIKDEYGQILHSKRWVMNQPNSISSVKFTNDASKIVSTSGNCDRFIKLWLRINYGDDNTLFEVSYLPHPKGTWVTEFQWRARVNDSINDSKILDQSLANIKNLRGYLDNGNEDNLVLYTITNDNILRIWASHDYSGHSLLKLWNTVNLNCLSVPVKNILIVENLYLLKSFIPKVKQSKNKYFQNKNLSDFDLLIIIGESGIVRFYAIWNITQTPPNSIIVEPIENLPEFQFNENTFPNTLKVSSKHELTLDYVNSQEFSTLNNPLEFPLTSYLNDTESSPISIIIHDRLKNSLRVCSLDFSCLLDFPNCLSLGTALLNKFQGQSKSIQKLIKSTSSYSKHNVLLSVLDFYNQNFIWEPIYLNSTSDKPMTITKRFQIEIDPAEGNRIWDAVIANDVQHKDVKSRRHLVATLEKAGYLSLWDCDTFTSDDQPGILVNRLQVCDKNGNLITYAPRSFILVNSHDISHQYYVIAIFEKDLIKAWRIRVIHDNKSIKEIDLIPFSIQNLPQEEDIHLIANYNSIIDKGEKDLLSVIDSNGVLRIYTIDFTFAKYELIWKQSYVIDTNIKNASKIHGSDVIDKIAVVDETKLNLSIWEIKSGVLEYEETYPKDYGEVRDLDWTFIHSSTDQLATNAILSVGFQTFVLLYTQLRYDYTNKMPTFAVIEKVDISNYTSHEIGDLIWLNDCFLVIASGNQFYIDDKWIRPGSSQNSSLDSIIRQLLVGYSKPSENQNEKQSPSDDRVYDINHLVAILNGPLPIYHPQFVIQALYMNQVKFVQEIFVNLFQAIRKEETIVGDLNMDIDGVILSSLIGRPPQKASGHDTPMDVYAESNGNEDLEIFKSFNSALADSLVDKLMKTTLPLLTRHQQSTLVSIISIVKFLKKVSASLDDNGMRFLLRFKLFQMSSKQNSLNMRDISWALHSDNKEVLLAAVEDYYKYKLKWENVKLTGLVYWVKTHRLINVIEQVARTEFSNTRDPSGRLSLLYLALRKKQILIGLWKTVSHPEQQKMLKFLSNDFSQPRWRSAALKNAFVLLGQHRYMDAAYFFLLGDSVKDCCATLAGKVDDIHLAIAVAKVYASSDSEKHHSNDSNEGLRAIIENYILPDAISNGDRWICSWVFWQLDLKEVSIQALIKSPIHIISQNSRHFSKFCRDNYIKKLVPTHKGQSFLKDDPVLILMFNNLRLNKLNYLRGSLNITQLEEANFIIKVCTIYARMGCEYLAIILLRNWKFIEIDAATKLEWKDKIAQIENGEYKRRMSINDIAPPKPIRKTSLQRRGSIIESNAKEELKDSKNLSKPPPPPTAFEEPDMSSFDFGF